MADLGRTLVLIAVFFFILSFKPDCTSKQTGIQYIYTGKILQSFNRGDFSECLHYLYVTAHKYKMLDDSTNLFITWNRIAVLNYLLDKPYHGNASLKIASLFAKYKDNHYKYLGYAYKERDNATKAKEYLSFISESTDSFIFKASLYLDFQLEYLKYKKKSLFDNRVYNKLKNAVQASEDRKDTLWFGYAFLNYFLGKMEFNNLMKTECDYHFVNAIKVFESINHFSYEWIDSYYYLIFTSYYLNKISQSTSFYNRISEVYNKGLINKELIPYYYIIKGLYYSISLNRVEANDAIRQAINNSNSSSSEMKLIILFQLYTFFVLKEYNKAINWFEKYQDSVEQPYYVSLVAYSYFKLGNKFLAEKYARKTIEKLYTTGGKHSFLTYETIGDLYFEMGDLQKAEYYYEKYLELALNFYGNYHIIISSSYEYLAYLYWVKGDVEKSIINYQKDICSLVQVPYNNNFFQLPDISRSIDDKFLTSALRNQADVFYEVSKTLKNSEKKKEYLEAGLSFFELALKVATRYKFGLLREDKKLNYTRILNRIYSKLIEVCFELYNETKDVQYTYKAFEYAEKSKASLLLSMMRGTDARKLSMIPQNIAEKEDLIEKTTSNYLKLLAEENEKKNPDFSLIEDYNTQLQFMNQKQDSLIQIIKSDYTAYYNAKFNNDAIGIDSLKKYLNANQVMVLYALSQNYLDIFLISKTSFKAWHNKVDKTLFDNIAVYRKYVSTYTYDYSKDTSIYAFISVSNKLYNCLLGPVKKYLANKELIIVPDGELNTIPFEPLVTDLQRQIKTISYKELPYLIKQNTISYNYSATLYAYNCKQNAKVYKGSKLLAIAPSDFNIQMSAITNMNANELRGDSAIIAPIPGTIDEVKKIHKIFSGKLLIEGAATESNFLKYADKYNIIHIASHGLVNNEYPLFSKLVFSPESDSINDSYLNTYEIYNMDISAPLVVLSACNTGYGKVYKGEGIISLARGFFIAGAKNVVMTQWAVADKTSNKLMHNFYKHLSRKEQIADALRNAKNEYLAYSDEITSHPYFWAGYVSAGDASVSFESSGNLIQKKIWISALSIIIIIGFILVYKRKK